MSAMQLLERPNVRTVADLLLDARATLDRLGPASVDAAQRAGALLVDIRPHAQRVAEGEIPDTLVLERNVLEWRLDPTSSARVPEASYDAHVVVVCSEGYTSSLAAASLQLLGVRRATDLAGGFRAWEAAGLPTTAGGTPAGERSGRGMLHVDGDRWEASVHGRVVLLSAQEFRVLAALDARRDRVVTRGAMSEVVGVFAGDRSIDVLVCRLRRKLGEAAPLLVTVRGVGWRLLSRQVVPAVPQRR